MEHSKHSFHNLDSYIGLSRLSGLALSPDGTKLVTTLSTLSEDETKYESALWSLDPKAGAPARRLTFGENGESQPQFTANGDLMFVAKRSSEEDAKAEGWILPVAGGEARPVISHPAGVQSLSLCAHAADTVVLRTAAHSRAKDLEAEAKLRTGRKDKKVSAILHTGYPVRYWDHDLGPSTPHFYVGSLPALQDTGKTQLTDLTPGIGANLQETAHDAASNGDFLITEWLVSEGRASMATGLMRIDLHSGAQEMLLSPDGTFEYTMGKISPDSTHLAYGRWHRSTAETAPVFELWLMDLADGSTHQIAAGWDRWVNDIQWVPNGRSLLLTADDQGHSPIFQLSLYNDKITRLTDQGSFTNVVISHDSRTAYALRSSYLYPAEPVAIDLTHTQDLEAGEFAPLLELRSPAPRPALPGTLTEVATTAEDGSTVRAWLALPESASAANQAPLLLWIHGGPLGSWNAWSWRWSPWLLVAQGYAVLLPDPALSTGYGQDFIQRGWGRWGQEPYTDLLAITDAAEARDDIDETRTAAMGGSFGGYMANWVAGHTNRFKAIVTHASLWALEGFGKTTDAAFYWTREMSPEMRELNSPHHSVGNITTPMLVIHGDKDYRVPIGEGLRLWYELLADSGLPQKEDGSTEHQFLYFPDENHWILTPQHAKIWYQVVTEFLSQKVLGNAPNELPELLG
ncbi:MULTISPECIES: S9 family peptidase [Glutamicibacter]|uniref:Prolyl oligopeptidase family protein n=1 Tax=Glutamicibacter arilaitensis (strain DSM 16368 / CIP 108037 / IAM 15318 / JCM 13566 / NCIMB 14258 / Re117) TaxID=861360 RepID=A0ABP1U511_GLUAR|nr:MULTISPECIES: S9 family peptidase [Glutamicibacter]CBT77060.1 prolyl oligopeptidase family protein [Glutamicibacter arilaitensis Re117]